MDEQFISGRVQDIRELAAKADPFIKKRLLALAEAYERQLRGAPPDPTRTTGLPSRPLAKR